MTPQEMKEAALRAAKNEYDTVMEKFKSSIDNGELSCKFEHISEGTRVLLKQEGYNVRYRDLMGLTGYWEVRVD